MSSPAAPNDGSDPMQTDNEPPADAQPQEGDRVASVEDAEMSLDAGLQSEPSAVNQDGAHDINMEDDTGPRTMLETRIPAKKDATLREFLGKMDDYAPIIPDAVTNYYLTVAGLPPPPETSSHLARLLALATQKFIADIAADAYQYSRIRSTNTTSNNPLTGLGGAAGFGAGSQGAGDDAKQKAKETGKGAPLGGPRAGYGGGSAQSGAGRTVLTMEDLGMAVGEYGVNVKRGEFYR